MAHLAKTFECDVGLSDHTLGMGVAVAAATLGAAMIEKHLTLSRADGGPDAAFSMEPAEFAQMVTECRRAAESIGEVRYGPTKSEKPQLGLRRPSGGKRGGWQPLPPWQA
jgi:N-acetylneuraminate synthase